MLRTHLPDETALNSLCHYDALNDQWLVKVKIWPHEGSQAIELGTDKLEEFPSELMIAQAMLVA